MQRGRRARTGTTAKHPMVALALEYILTATATARWRRSGGWRRRSIIRIIRVVVRGDGVRVLSGGAKGRRSSLVAGVSRKIPIAAASRGARQWGALMARIS